MISLASIELKIGNIEYFSPRIDVLRVDMRVYNAIIDL